MSQSQLDEVFRDSLSEDRVFGYMTSKTLSDCFDKMRVEYLNRLVDALDAGFILVIGTGASSLVKPDLVLYFDINRWNIQLQYREGGSNWLWENPSAPVLEKYKRGFFIEWRLADRDKDRIFATSDYFVDANDSSNPKMMGRNAFMDGLRQAVHMPLRMQPYFDPGVWGGQWMKHTFSLDPTKENYAWSFDGVPEENSINLSYGTEYASFPMMDVILAYPEALLGHRNLARFGREFPIRFDLLDTMDGQNLSLQVHPLTEYIQHTFGMHYTQDESYYILDAKEGAYVYIGLKDGVDPAQMEEALRRAQRGESSFDADAYINKVPVHTHDHILIPAGTVHCSGADTMVLEISATPYIFTFKLWDWNRVGLDGIPRPTHLEHGMRNIQWDRTTKWVQNQLVHQEQELLHTDNVHVERTGLHEWEFIETRRYSVHGSYRVEMSDSMDVLNLVEGSHAWITSPDDAFGPFELHYAETVIIPSCVRRYCIESTSQEVKLIVASVRN
ncbi:MAG: class I mannose-6-phosphate isomerase [Sphaerochaetaceae bacterium]|nr:class I mannose-6-phosphate isomerase [Sphaerochaetaceae bacterium]